MAGIYSLVTSEEMLTVQNKNITQTLLEGNPLATNEVIAVIKVSGVITSSKGDSSSTSSHDIVETIDYILNSNTNIKALIVKVDSPGGEVTASDVIYNAIRKVKQRHIPVVVQMESMAASGGYYVSCHADHIVANPTTMTGSIGVIISGINIQEGMNKLGIKTQVFKSGEFKDMLSMTREMTDAESAYIQEMINQTYGQFVKLVSDGRGMTPEQLQAHNAIDGRIISGSDAKEIGLVDSLGYWQDAVEIARNLASAPNAAVIQYERKPSLSDIFSGFGLEAQSPKRVSVEIGNTSFPKLKAGVPYMLPSMYVTGSIVQE